MSNRKEEILIAALHLFAGDGYKAVSVSRIAGELDMTKGALYRHYKSKRDILTVLWSGWSSKMANRRQIMICRKMIKRECLKSMRRCRWMIS